MTKKSSPHHQSVVLTFRFFGTSTIGSVIMGVVSAFGPLPVQVAVLGSFVSILGGMFLSYLEQEDQREERRQELLRMLAVPVRLAGNRALFAQYQNISKALEAMADQTDSILRQFVMLKLANLGEQLQMLADGTIVFPDTEAWRTIYDQFLRSPDITKYWSVAWVKSADYWQDQPGKQSLEANFDAVRRGMMIHRLVIISDPLWPKSAHLPIEPIRQWIEDQNTQGIWLGLVRESAVAHESDLLADIGVYGDRAVGMQELDEQSRTVRFVLSFDAAKVQDAKARWDRLKLYAISYWTLLDQLETKE